MMIIGIPTALICLSLLGCSSAEWEDFNPIFPRFVNGRFVRRGLQRRRNDRGSCSETAEEWTEYRIKPRNPVKIDGCEIFDITQLREARDRSKIARNRR